MVNKLAQAGNDLSANRLNVSSKAMNQTAARNIPAATAARFQNIATMRTYLLANGYTNAQLDIMTANDMRYAVMKKSSI